jgi:hypothetical protein
MKTTYQFQPYLRDAQPALLTMLFGSILVIWALPVWSVLQYGVVILPFLRLAQYASFAVLAFAGLCFIALAEIRGYSISISETEISGHSLHRTWIIPFSSINRLYRRRLPGWHGFAVLKAGKVTLRFASTLQNSSDLLGKLAEGCKAYNCLINEADILNLKKEFFISEAINNRIYTEMSMAIRIAIGIVCVSSIIGLFVWNLSLIFTIAWILLSMALVPSAYLSAYLSANTMLYRRMLHEQDTAPSLRDIGGIYRQAGIAAGFVYLIAGIVFKAVAQ